MTTHIKDKPVPDDLSDEDYAALADFRFALRRFLRFTEEAAQGAGLTPQQHQALLAIRARGQDGMLVGDLAERLLLKPHSASELVKRLVERDLVERRPGSTDRREVHVCLTAHARELLVSLSATNTAELRRLRPLLQRLLKGL